MTALDGRRRLDRLARNLRVGDRYTIRDGVTYGASAVYEVTREPMNVGPSWFTHKTSYEWFARLVGYVGRPSSRPIYWPSTETGRAYSDDRMEIWR